MKTDPNTGSACCPTCEGPLMVLGSWTTFTHYRCRNCGDTFTREDNFVGYEEDHNGGNDAPTLHR